MNKFFLSLVCMLLTEFSIAQSLLLNGNIVIENASSEGCRVVIYKNNIRLTEETVTKRGHFEFKLSLDADYKIAFEKDGYITKNVSVNTEVPSEIVESNPNFPPVKVIITLLPKVEDVDLSIFEQPIAILAYNYELDDFTFDSEYGQKIKDKVAQTEQQIKKILAEKGSAALKQEQLFAEYVSKGQRQYDTQKWQEAINNWQQALTIKPGNEDIQKRVAMARKELELETARKSVEQQNAQSYRLLIASADSLFNVRSYPEAKENYTAAIRLNAKDTYPPRRINEINKILAEQTRDEANQQKKLLELENNYKKQIALGDNAFATKDYTTALQAYREAQTLKPQETYPKEKIKLIENAIAEKNKRLAAEEEKKRQEEQRRAALKGDYDRLIAEADAAFQAENYSLARLRYTEADALNLGEEYPKKQLAAIENIINSSKYKAKLAEYKKNKTLGEKSLEEKNYASAKFYYQKALGILPIDKEEIEKQIADIDRQIEAERLAAIQKEYDAHITKADKAFKEKAYAVAKFYYQKALEVKKDDAYAQKQLKELGKFISDRQEKEAQF